MEPKGTIAFSTVGIPFYGFDVFSVHLPTTTTPLDDPVAFQQLSERRHTDGVSANFNAQFVDEAGAVTFVSERTGSSRLYRTEPHNPKPEPLLTSSSSLFHDRPTINNGRLVFVSAHEPRAEWFKSWAAVYSTDLSTGTTVRLTPKDAADFSPAVSRSGSRIAVASYGSRKWEGDFRETDTEVAVFERSDPDARTVVSRSGGWPAWSGDNALYFHRKSDDGWWSVFRSDLDGGEPRRVTPAGVHAFTPAASHDGRLLAVATRRKGSKFRHVELFDLRTGDFVPVTAGLNPDLHHYNPFFSPESGRLGYHRSRKESDGGEYVVHHFRQVKSPVKTLTMLRFPTTFPSFSPAGDYLAVNGDFFASPGMMIVKSDGSKRWTLLEEPSAFFTAWSPTEAGVIYTSIGPIFESSAKTVHIARVSFDPADLERGDAIAASVKLLTRTAGNNAFPSCSPDGKSIVFRSGRSGFKNLYIVDAVNGETDGGDGIRRLTEGEWTDTMPSWSPDGELIAFSSNRHDPESPTGFSIYLVRPDGSGLRRVHVAGAEGSEDVDRERINHVCFSPDSEWLLFTANFGGVVAEPISLPNHYQPYGDLYVCRVDGTGLRRLTCNAYENGTPVWGGGLDLGLLNLGADEVGEKWIGRYEEPLWLTCDVWFIQMMDVFPVGLLLSGSRKNGEAIYFDQQFTPFYLITRYLGIPPPEDLKGSSFVRMSWLRENFMDVDRTVDDEVIAVDDERILRCTRTYLLCLCGAILFPDASENMVNVRLLPFLDDLTKSTRYAWGAATLAYLYAMLSDFVTKKDRKNMRGCISLVQMYHRTKNHLTGILG